MTTMVIEKNVMVPMRDDVRLATDIYRLEHQVPAPVLVTRSPYNKDGITSGNYGLDVFRAVQAGYVVVAQDVRGRYASDGAFEPMVHETSDGVDTFAWAASQPWSSGVVGTFGGSYLGATQWLPARENPPALKAMVPSVTFSDMYEGMAYQGGAKVMHDLRWVVQDIVPAELRRRAARGETTPAIETPLEVDAALNELPLGSHPLIREAAPFYRRWLTSPATDPLWAEGSPSAGYDRITAPALNIGGWYDIFTWSTLRNFTEMRTRGGSEAARRHQRVIIGPWCHANLTGSFPEREFGPDASHAAIDLGGIQLRWFDHWLKGVDTGADEQPPVKIFVMGIDEWRDEPDWPLPGTRYRDWFLHSGGKANSLHGDGTLSTEPPTSEPPDTYLYDPMRPVPTVGGQVLLPGANATGPRDQRSVETAG